MRELIDIINTIGKDSLLEGYVWMSDAKSPYILNQNKWVDEVPDSVQEVSNPFVIESLLYDSTKELSYYIKYVDGKYVFKSFEIKGLGDNYVEDSYIAAFDNAPGKLIMRQYWTNEPDEMCNNFDVLQPSAWAFVGFKK